MDHHKYNHLIHRTKPTPYLYQLPPFRSQSHLASRYALLRCILRPPSCYSIRYVATGVELAGHATSTLQLSSMLTFSLAQSTTTLASSTATANAACTASAFAINSQSDLTTLTACSAVSGNVVISQNIPQVNLGGITSIDGDLSIINNGTGTNSALAAITSLSGSSLQTITGTFTLTQLTQLSSMSFPSLSQVGGIAFTTLPVLQSLGFGGLSEASSVLITDTQLSSLAGINLRKAETIALTSNGDLSTINFSTLSAVDTSLLISNNAQGCAVSFPALTNCGNMTIQQVGSLSINALANVTGSLGIQQTSLTTIAANNLTRITQDLFITNNTALTNISMPMLQTIAGFVIANNTQLSDISFPALTTVQAVDLSGTFSTVELPALTRVNGGVNIQTTANPFTCPIQQSIVRSTSFVCRGALANPTRNSTGTTGGSTGTSGTSASGSARSGASTLSVGFVGGLLALAAYFM